MLKSTGALVLSFVVLFLASCSSGDDGFPPGASERLELPYVLITSDAGERLDLVCAVQRLEADMSYSDFLAGARAVLDGEEAESFREAVIEARQRCEELLGSPPAEADHRGASAPGAFEVSRTTVTRDGSAEIRVTNLSDEAIRAWDVLICVYNIYGEPERRGGSHCFRGLSESTISSGGDTETGVWSLTSFEAPNSITVEPIRSLTAQGIWRP